MGLWRLFLELQSHIFQTNDGLYNDLFIQRDLFRVSRSNHTRRGVPDIERITYAVQMCIHIPMDVHTYSICFKCKHVYIYIS